MTIVELNDNNNIENIVNHIPGGKIRKCVLSEKNIERLSPIIRLAHYIENSDNAKVYIQVKFDSKYSPRPKRLEVVSETNEAISIFKFCKKSTFEKECLETQRVITELKEKYQVIFKGYIVLSEIIEDYRLFQNRINEISKDITLICRS